MSNKYLILDCFVDEPACFGIPPFISPYPRYIYGALIDAGVSPDMINYHTIDRLRLNNYQLDDSYNIVFLIGGAVVPGKYLGSKIGTSDEIKKIIEINQSHNFATGGLIRFILENVHNNLTLLKYDIEKFAFQYAVGQPADLSRTSDDISRWAVNGAELVKLHPDYPDIICEIESSRGCPRQTHCSFCSEGLMEKIEFRNEEEIISEIESLIFNGVSRFRIGRQADILQYKTSFSDFSKWFPKT